MGRGIAVGMPALARALCDTLGLDANRVHSINLDIQVNAAVIATVELYALSGDGATLTDALLTEQYRIERIEP